MTRDDGAERLLSGDATRSNTYLSGEWRGIEKVTTKSPAMFCGFSPIAKRVSSNTPPCV